MKVIIVGLGRMGSGLAKYLEKKGHTVTVIDYNQMTLDELEQFSGTKILGDGLDREILMKAQIDRVDAVVSCTSEDEINAVVARVAKYIYKVPRVVARLYDTGKADIYHRLGIQTISTVSWGIHRACELLTYNQMDTVFDLGNANVRVVRLEVPMLLVGHHLKEITMTGEIQVVAVSRNNRTFIPETGTVMEAEDILYISVISSAIAKLKAMFDLA